MKNVITSLVVLMIVGCGNSGSSLIVAGIDGKPGLAGPKGADGHSSLMTQVPADSTVCANGGAVISSGLDSDDDGVLAPSEIRSVSVVCNGLNGSAGVDGVHATPVTIVNLCPGVNTYPSVFIEVGICLNNKLYGVYSTNGGFMTYLSDGAWSSNAIGSACNLTISGCTVSH